MKAYILSTETGIKTYSTVRLKEEAKKMGIALKVLVPEKFELVIENGGVEQIFYNGKLLPLPDVFIPRFSVTYFTHMITSYFEHNPSVLVLNHTSSRKLAKDKMLSLQHLAYNNIPVPKSILVKFPLDIDFIEKNISYPLVLKKTEGSQGKGIILCENRNQFEDVIEMMESTVDVEKTNFILQEFLSEKKGQDIRVFVIGGRAIGAMLRSGKAGDFKANFSGGGTVKPFKMNHDIEWLAVESARIIGLDIAGVDILFDKDGYKICEVNASPGFEGFEQANGINVPQEIFNYIKLRVGE